MSNKIKNELVVYWGSGFLIILLVELAWFWQGSFSLIHIVELLAGFLIGSLLFDIDHFIYWFVSFPKKPESLVAQTLLREKKHKELFMYLINTRQKQTSLIFHHIYFQAVIIIVGGFIFTSSASVITRSLIVFLNLHLVLDQWRDFISRPRHLQKWLFARLKLRLPLRFLKYYLFLSTLIFLVFLSGLITYR